MLLAVVTLTRLHAQPLVDHLPIVAALTALSVTTNLIGYQLRLTMTRSFDIDIGLVLTAVALAGPLAGAIVAGLPELVHLARRRRSSWHIGLTANYVSIAATALAGAAVLALWPAGGAARLLTAGLTMLVANYVFAWLLLTIVRDGGRPLLLLRTQLLPVLPLAMVVVLIGTISALLVPAVGILALAGFATIVYVPQLAAMRLLGASSVATLDIDDAAVIYREALADEMSLSAERRYLHTVDALAQRRPLGSAPANPLAASNDAMLVTICTERPPTQPNFTASPQAQLVLVARRWAQLTARCTPALSHSEAMHELCASTLARDAPLALLAADRLVRREQPLSNHIAAAPRLYRAPLPRTLRQGLLPDALARLIA